MRCCTSVRQVFKFCRRRRHCPKATCLAAFALSSCLSLSVCLSLSDCLSICLLCLPSVCRSTAAPWLWLRRRLNLCTLRSAVLCCGTMNLLRLVVALHVGNLCIALPPLFVSHFAHFPVVVFFFCYIYFCSVLLPLPLSLSFCRSFPLVFPAF